MKLTHHRRGGALLAAASMALLLTAMLAPGAQARVEKFEVLAPSPAPLTAVAADPTTDLIYAQENEGEHFFAYNPRTNAWSELAPAPLESGNNGGATYLNGKLYLSYTEGSELAVYDIATGTWTTIPSPLGRGTGDITSGNGKLFLAVEQDFVQFDPATGITTPLANPPAFEPSECGQLGFWDWGGLQFDGAQIYGHQGNGCTGFGVYNVAGNSWTELTPTPRVESIYEEEHGVEEPEGPVLGSALYPTTNTYLAYGPYSGKTLFRYDIEAGSWSTSKLSFGGPEPEIGDGGMAYIGTPGLEGVYMVEGENGEQFGRYTEQNQTALSPTISANVVGNPAGAQITYSVRVTNHGPERASGVVLANALSGATLVSLGTAQGTCNGTTCELGVLHSGQSVAVVVKADAAPGTVTDTVTVTSQAVNTATGSASVTSTVAGPPAVVAPVAQCVIPKKLRGKRLKRAKKALRAAHCKPGKVIHRNNAKVKKGRVVRTSKKAGKSLPAGTKVNLTVSKGPKKHGVAHHKH